uniref:Uncharacterized protein n=1 Tax=Tanacetum cinerariifolium TaxID=118510 RepID=A0A6L2M5U6_TANCI|nr:hypothetical protein [Tanacetum cinerariifolium]
MSTKIELALEQLRQGVSNDILDLTSGIKATVKGTLNKKNITQDQQEGPTNFALMACTSQGSSSSYTKSHLEIIAYQVGLESLKARIVIHEKNEAVYEEDIKILKINVMLRGNALAKLKNQMKNALKEKDDLKLKLEKFETSSHNLTKLINYQLSANDKTGLGYDSQMNKSDLNDVYVNESQVIANSLIDSHESDGEDNQVNVRFKKSERYHAVPPLYTGNYMSPRADLSFVRLDDSVFKFAISETITNVNETETNSEDENVVKKTEVKKTVKPSLEMIEFVNARNTTVENERKDEKLVRKPVKYAEMYRQVNTARPKAMINVVRMNQVNDVKASVCWFWRPIKPNSASITLKRYDYVDVRGRSRTVMACVPKNV